MGQGREAEFERKGAHDRRHVQLAHENFPLIRKDLTSKPDVALRAILPCRRLPINQAADRRNTFMA